MRAWNYFKLFFPLVYLLGILAVFAIGIITLLLDELELASLIVIPGLALVFGQSWWTWSQTFGQGKIAFDKGDLRAAHQKLHQALDLAKPFPETDARRGLVLDYLGQLYYTEGRYAECEPFLLKALGIHQRIWGEFHAFTWVTKVNLANFYLTQARFDEAEQIYREYLQSCERQSDKPSLAKAVLFNNLGRVESDQERYAKAEPLFRQALDQALASSRIPKYFAGLLRSNLALSLAQQGKLEEAEPLAQRAYEELQAKLGPNHCYLYLPAFQLARVRIRQSRFPDAETHLRAALALMDKTLDPEHPDRAIAYHLFGQLYQCQGQPLRAEEYYLQAISLRQTNFPSHHPLLLRTLGEYRALLKQLKREPPSEAVRPARPATVDDRIVER